MLQMFASGFIAALLSAVHEHIVINMGVAMIVGALMSFVQVRRLSTT
jgi:hypothetical protein